MQQKVEFCSGMKDVFGNALLDYQKGYYTEDIETTSSLDETDSIPLPYLFRNFDEMPPLEQKALGLCKGSILDIGCGAGSHSLYLQGKGLEVTALDSSKGAIETCQLRGIVNRVHTDIVNFKNPKFDTLLLLMNGIGIVGQLENLGGFLEHLKTLLMPGGQIILDSSDIIYMFDEDSDSSQRASDSGRYYGEVAFIMNYKNLKSEPFFWLYVDYGTLKDEAENCGMHCEILKKGEYYDYLARLW